MSARFRALFALSCAVLSVLLCLNYASYVQAEADRVRSETLARYGGEVVTLVVSATTLEPGDVANSMNVTTREWLADLAPEGALTSLDDVIGREVGNAAPRGVPLTDITFRDASTMAEVPDGRVAVTLPVTDKLGVAHDLSRGTTLTAYAITSDGARLISHSMTVIAVPVTTAMGTSGQLTVAVAPEDVPAVLSASASSDLRIVMPGSGVLDDDESADPAAPAQIEDGQKEEAKAAS
ncbi:MAG: hypothetical protein IJ781_14440 [Atopobiaceae bacterium]|nr:hypothetical protein [Atopobiaceae bacterium]